MTSDLKQRMKTPWRLPGATRGAASVSRAPSEDTPAAGGASSRRRRRRWTWIGGLTSLIVVVAFVATSLLLFVFPSTDRPIRADGILSLNGPDEGARTAMAVALAEKGYAPVLLFSQGGDGADTSCPKVAGISVVCFVDVTDDTRGEAEWAARYAEHHHWHSLLIVPGRAQATRARLLTERCFSGRVTVVPAAEHRPALSEIIHEWGGLFDALFVERSC